MKRIVLILLLTACRPAAAAEPFELAGPPAEQTVEAPDLNTVLARSDAGKYTVADLRDYLEALAPPTLEPDQKEMLIRQPMTTLRALARRRFVEQGVARIAEASSPTLMASLRDELNHIRAEEILNRIKLRELQEAENVSLEDARNHYEKNKFEFSTPLQFHMRHLSLLAYIRYTTQPGDSLEQIAEEISGSKEMIGKILTDATGKLPRWTPEEERDNRPFVPLTAGERLLVPMDPETRRETRRILAETILPKLDQGMSFEQLANTYSEAPDKGIEIGPLPFGSTPMLPQILEVASRIPIGEVSDIIDTEHGFEVIQVTQRKDERIQPFEEALPDIREGLEDSRYRASMAEIFDRIWDQMSVDAEQIIDPGTPDPAPVVRSFRRTWTKGEILELTKKDRSQFPTPETILSAVKTARPVFDQLVIEYAEKQGFLRAPQLAKRLDIRTNQHLTLSAMEREFNQRWSRFDEDRLRAWHRDHIERFTPPKRYIVRQLVKRVDTDEPRSTLAEMRELTDGIEELSEFVKIVREHSEDRVSSANDGRLPEVTEGYRPGPFSDAMRSVEPGVPSEPFVHGDFAYVIWVEGVTQPEPPPFEEMRNTVRDMAAQDVRARIDRDISRAALEAIGYTESGTPAESS